MVVGRSPHARPEQLEARLQPDFRWAWQSFCAGGPLPAHPKVQTDIIVLLGQLVQIDRAGPTRECRWSLGQLERALEEQRRMQEEGR